MIKSFTVSQLNRYVKSMLEEDIILADITVSGEIMGFKAHSSGHWYFTLKDEGGSVPVAMFKWQRTRTAFTPQNGMKVRVQGKITLYEQTGQYQMVGYMMRPDGVGSLHAAYEQIRDKLRAEGLFNQERKRKLPRLPEKIGVVTSKNGAALQDILNILARRYPIGEIVLYPVTVQGEDAPGQIAAGIKKLSSLSACDVIIVGRGGGAAEDLWAFNTEEVARAVADCPIPVISAVGHETDVTLCDFAADLRAPTPSAAAELAAPDIADIGRGVNNAMSVMQSMMNDKLYYFTDKIRNSSVRIENKSPQNQLLIQSARLEWLRTRIESAADKKIKTRRELLPFLESRISTGINKKLDRCGSRLAVVSARLTGLGPFEVLRRGYCAAHKNGKIISSVAEAARQNSFTVRFWDGDVECRVVNT